MSTVHPVEAMMVAAIAALVLTATFFFLATVPAPPISTSPPTYFTNTTVNHWNNQTLYANSTIIHNYSINRTLYANATYWNNQTMNRWSNTTLYSNMTVVEPVQWPVRIDGLASYIVCHECRGTNFTVNVNTTSGAGTDELFGVQVTITTGNTHRSVVLQGEELVTYDPANVTNTSMSPFFLWDEPSPEGPQTIHPGQTFLERLMVEAPEVPGMYDLGVVLYIDGGC